MFTMINKYRIINNKIIKLQYNLIKYKILKTKTETHKLVTKVKEVLKVE